MKIEMILVVIIVGTIVLSYIYLIINIFLSALICFFRPNFIISKYDGILYKPFPINFLIKNFYKRTLIRDEKNKHLKKFIRILKNENIYTKFLINFKSKKGIEFRKKNALPLEFEDFFEYIYNKHDINIYYRIIDNSFIWVDSKEGRMFWRDIAHTLLEKYDKNEISEMLKK